MHHPEHFNTDGLRNAPFARSTVKGPESEGVAVGRVDDHLVAVGNELGGTTTVYEVQSPERGQPRPR